MFLQKRANIAGSCRLFGGFSCFGRHWTRICRQNPAPCVANAREMRDEGCVVAAETTTPRQHKGWRGA